MSDIAVHEPVPSFGKVPKANQPGHHPAVEQDKPDLSRRRSAPDPRQFEFRFEALLRPLALAVGVVPSTARVEVDDEDVLVRFGRWSMTFERSDIAAVQITGPYQLIKVAGPPRLSFADGGITFATNRQRGVCVQLFHAHPGIEPLGVVKHASVTLTVADPEGLAALLDPA